MMDSVQQLVVACIDAGILVTPEMIENPLQLKQALSEANDEQKTVLSGLPSSALYKTENTILILKNYLKLSKKSTAQDFVKYFNKRLQAISGILRGRQELQNVTSISRILAKKEPEQVAIIGMVTEKQVNVQSMEFNQEL